MRPCSKTRSSASREGTAFEFALWSQYLEGYGLFVIVSCSIFVIFKKFSLAFLTVGLLYGGTWPLVLVSDLLLSWNSGRQPGGHAWSLTHGDWYCHITVKYTSSGELHLSVSDLRKTGGLTRLQISQAAAITEVRMQSRLWYSYEGERFNLPVELAAQANGRK